MNRKFLCAALVTLFTVGIALSGEYPAVITKVVGDKVTFQKYKKGEKGKGKGGFGKKGEKDGDPITLSATGVKVSKGKFDKGEMKLVYTPIDDGLKDKMFTEIGEMGVNATIVTDDGDKLIKEIKVFGGGKGKKKKDAQ